MIFPSISSKKFITEIDPFGLVGNVIRGLGASALAGQHHKIGFLGRFFAPKTPHFGENHFLKMNKK